jgi:hypothetical protein
LTIKKWLKVGKHNALSGKREERERERERERVCLRERSVTDNQ